MQSGAFANALIISHSPSDFCLDFVTTFFPNSAVSSRVFLSAGQLPGLVQSLTTTYDHYRRQSAPSPDSPGSPGSSDMPPSPDDPPQHRHDPDSLSGESREKPPQGS
ncbi:MAG: DUF3467 domain-containing protein [Phycisphaerales bacterium]|nr:DUF3467 domain-containing protein [Phycisphaerales bacterium]